jgi:hypothetical protein
MRRVFFIIIFLISLNGIAQIYEYVPFPDSGAIWSERFTYPEGIDSIAEYSFERFATNGEDTLINSVLYKKLFLFYDTTFNKNNAVYIGGIREDNKKVYYLGDTIHRLKPLADYFNFEEILLYDFNLNEGDTIEMGMGFADSIPCNYAGTLIVENIDTVLVGGVLRKKIVFWGINMTWIEGIGNTYGLLFITSHFLTSGSPQNTLICFKQNDTILYFNNNYTECMPLNISNKATEHNTKVTIFPNPANDKLNIEIKENSNEFSIVIFNLLGQMVKQDKLDQMTNEINISNLTKGIYNVSIINKNEIVNFKIIKE